MEIGQELLIIVSVARKLPDEHLKYIAEFRSSCSEIEKYSRSAEICAQFQAPKKFTEVKLVNIQQASKLVPDPQTSQMVRVNTNLREDAEHR